MNNATSLNDYQDILSSQSSDEKMDTGSESFLSTQDTPNSVLSSDFDDKDQSGSETDKDTVLRLQNPKNTENTVFKPSEACQKSNGDLKESLISKMTLLRLDSLDAEENGKSRPKHLGISPPKFSSALTTTTNHPLMGLGSPDSAVENYPDVVPKKIRTVQEEPKDLSLSSIEDEKNTNETNSFTDFYSPQRNTSKNNLYFNDNFTTAESQEISRIDYLTSQPDVARVHSAGDKETVRRKIIPAFRETDLLPKVITVPGPQRVLGRIVDGNSDESAILKYVEERNKKLSGYNHSTPNKSDSFPDNSGGAANKTDSVDNSIASNARGLSISVNEEFHSGVADWVDSPSQLRSMPNFQLPVELSSHANEQSHDLDSPDVLSSSTQEDRSSYQATVDPYSGSVALRHTAGARPGLQQRRRIALPPEQDSCSLDSGSLCSLDSDEEAGAPPPPPAAPAASAQPAPSKRGESDDDSKRDSSPSVSEYSEPIPEYSAAEERREERAWLRVALADGGRANCDMKVIEPYKRVLSHGGYECAGAAIIVFSACHLPDSARVDYAYVMDNLFLYVIWSLERLVTEEYVLVYLHGSASRRRLPAWRWLHECYRLIDRRLRKSLKHLYLVHPTFWLKSIVLLSKPFVSSKFFRKLSYVRNLNELMDKVPVEPNAIPDLVKTYDMQRR